MELKVNIKTILLFSAFFILAGMILGFYSCSAHNTPTIPDTTNVVPPPVPTVLDTDPTTPIVVLPGPPTTDGSGDTGVIMSGYTFTVDSDGNTIITSARENTVVSGAIPDPGGSTFTLMPGIIITFSPFTVQDNTITGVVTITNASSDYILINPRLNYVISSTTPSYDPIDFAPGDPSSLSPAKPWDPSILSKAGLVNRDGFSTVLSEAQFWQSLNLHLAYPFVFIADEEEHYMVIDGESVSHEIVLEFDESHVTTYYAFFTSELIQSDGATNEDIVTGIPRNVSLVLLEDPGSVNSYASATVDMDYFDPARPCVALLDLDYIVYQLEYSGVDAEGKYILDATIPAKPSVDAPFTLITVIFPTPTMTTIETIPGASTPLPANKETFFFLSEFE